MNNDPAILTLTYLTELAKSGDETHRYLADLNQFLIKRNCTFQGRPMPTLLKPVFISLDQARNLRHTVDLICGALIKFIKFYLENEQVRSIMKFSRQENQLFFLDPGYSIPLVIARLDAFMNDDSIKFLEFNCDSPAGIAYADIIEEGFRELFIHFPFLKNWNFNYFNRQELLLQALLECYREFRSHNPGFPSRPTIAIVDWEGLSTSSEFELLKIFFEENGFPTIITSPQKIQVIGDRVRLEGKKIDLIYRRVITRELLNKIDEVREYIRVIQGGYACVCNPFQSYIVGNKKILSLLTDPRFQSIYSDEEKEIIRQSIPWTRILADNTASYRGSTIELKSFVSQNKDILVLKPANSYGGKNVYLGKETDKSIWENLIKTKISDEEWVVQEYVPIPEEFFPAIEDKTTISLKKVNINPFAFLGRYGGTISRISENSIINVSAGGGLVPTIRIKKREADALIPSSED